MKDAVEMNSTTCIVQCGGCFYGIPASAVCEVLDWQAPIKVPLAPACIEGVVVHRGDVLTVVSLAALLRHVETVKTPTPLVLESEDSGERFVLVVDEVHAVAVLDEATREPNPENLDPHFNALFDGAYCGPERFVARLNLPRISPDRLSELFDSIPSIDNSGDNDAHADCG